MAVQATVWQTGTFDFVQAAQGRSSLQGMEGCTNSEEMQFSIHCMVWTN